MNPEEQSFHGLEGLGQPEREVNLLPCKVVSAQFAILSLSLSLRDATL